MSILCPIGSISLASTVSDLALRRRASLPATRCSTSTSSSATFPETRSCAGLPPVGLRKTSDRSLVRSPLSKCAGAVRSAGTSCRSGTTSSFETLRRNCASSDCPKGRVEPVATIGVPLSLSESFGVTMLSRSAGSVLTNGNASVRSSILWSIPRVLSTKRSDVSETFTL